MTTQLRTITDAVTAAKPAFDRIEKMYSERNETPPVVFQREAEFAMQICERNDYLAKPSMLPSLMHAIKNVALVGITLNPALKLAYLVPRDGMACLDISYMGLIKIATDSGSVTRVNCQLVYERDFFEIEHGTNQRLVHKPDVFGDRGELIGVYCLATLHDGSMMVETMSMDDVNRIRNRSKAKKGPWATDFCEMARKTCVKRASKYWPKTERLAEAIRALDAHEGYADISTPENVVSVDQEQQEQPQVDIKALRMRVMDVLKREADEDGANVREYAESTYGIKTVAGMAADQCEEFLAGKESPEVIEGEVVA